MRILAAKIDWHEDYANTPTLQVLVESVPPVLGEEGMVYRRKELTEFQTLYYAEQDGMVNYFVHDVRDQRGYGGAVFAGKLEDGSAFRISGPWSGSASAVQMAGFGPCVDVHMVGDLASFKRGHTFTAAAITLDAARSAVGRFCPEAEMALYKKRYGDFWAPRMTPSALARHMDHSILTAIRAIPYSSVERLYVATAEQQQEAIHVLRRAMNLARKTAESYEVPDERSASSATLSGEQAGAVYA